MKDIDKDNRTFWGTIFPRLVATGMFAWLIYTLVFEDKELNSGYVVLWIIVGVLVLAPMARRLKIFNVFDFSSRIGKLTEEQKATRREVVDLRNQVSSFIKLDIKPVQSQTNIFTLSGVEKGIMRGLEIEDKVITQKGEEDERLSFLIRASEYRRWAAVVLALAFNFKIARQERELMGGTKIDKGNTIDERIRYYIKDILENGIEETIPIRLKKEDGEIETLPLGEITKNLQDLSKLLDLRQEVWDNKSEVPERSYVNKLFSNVHEVVVTISAAVDVIGMSSIIDLIGIMDRIRGLGEEVEKAEKEGRPIGLNNIEDASS